MTTNKEEIRRWLDLYMEGKTSLEEEALLAEYFRSPDADKDFADFKTMFNRFDEGEPSFTEEEQGDKGNNRHTSQVPTQRHDAEIHNKRRSNSGSEGTTNNCCQVIGETRTAITNAGGEQLRQVRTGGPENSTHAHKTDAEEQHYVQSAMNRKQHGSKERKHQGCHGSKCNHGLPAETISAQATNNDETRKEEYRYHLHSQILLLSEAQG